jgi:diguanylate cyclase (GGDEF)-like protein
MNSNLIDNNYSGPILIADRLWWVGHLLEDDNFQCHAYVLENGENSVLFDPGSALTWSETRRKIEQIMPLENIAYVVCHHQDPDITTALASFVAASSRTDLRLITHWRTHALTKHLGVDIEVWEVQENNWVLELDDRKLTFVPTPYLHFAGAFCTFDEATGTLFSSDLFGGFTDSLCLYLDNEDQIDGIEAFHEHYMPGREFLLNGIIELERHPIKTIAPQHGLIIREEFISEVYARLKVLECGLFLLQSGGDGFESLQIHNRVLKDTLSSLISEKEFSAVANKLAHGLRQIMAIDNVAFIAPWNEKEHLVLTPENRFNGSFVEHLPCQNVIGLTSEEFAETNGGCSLLAVDALPSLESLEVPCKSGYVLPLYSDVDQRIMGLVKLRVSDQAEIKDDVAEVLERLAPALAVSLEREISRHRLEKERDAIFEQSIRDPLTNLFTRRYMDEVASRMMTSHGRDQLLGVAALMMDIDHFKLVNDTYGHPVGDVVLQKLSGIMLHSARESDLPVRFGGEEFVFFIVVENLEDAVVMADRLRLELESMTFESDKGPFQVTMSIGVALHKDERDVTELISKADQALYFAKENGRNRVVAAGETVVTS